jgi:hypothetical protein
VVCNFPILLILWMQNLDYSVSVTSLKSTSMLMVLQKMQGNPKLHLNAPQWMVGVNCILCEWFLIVFSFQVVWFEDRHQRLHPLEDGLNVILLLSTDNSMLATCNLHMLLCSPFKSGYRTLGDSHMVPDWYFHGSCPVMLRTCIASVSYPNSSEEKGWVGW